MFYCAVKICQVSFEHNKWFDVPLEESQQLEYAFCMPSNDSCIVQVNSIFCLYGLLLRLTHSTCEAMSCSY